MPRARPVPGARPGCSDADRGMPASATGARTTGCPGRPVRGRADANRMPVAVMAGVRRRAHLLPRRKGRRSSSSTPTSSIESRTSADLGTPAAEPSTSRMSAPAPSPSATAPSTSEGSADPKASWPTPAATTSQERRARTGLTSSGPATVAIAMAAASRYSGKPHRDHKSSSTASQSGPTMRPTTLPVAASTTSASATSRSNAQR